LRERFGKESGKRDFLDIKKWKEEQKAKNKKRLI